MRFMRGLHVFRLQHVIEVLMRGRVARLKLMHHELTWKGRSRSRRGANGCKCWGLKRVSGVRGGVVVLLSAAAIHCASACGHRSPGRTWQRLHGGWRRREKLRSRVKRRATLNRMRDGTLMRPMGAESLASECLRGGWGAEAQFRERRAHESALQEDEAAAAWDSNCHEVVVLGPCDACCTPYLQNE